MKDRVKLDAFDESKGVSLMDGTGVTYEDILGAVMTFNIYASNSKGSALVEFFNRKHLRTKVVKALALIGMKHVCDELNRKMKGGDGGNS